MTTVQTVKYMQSIYRKYQIFAIACTVLTLIASSLAALSGIQLNNLRKSQAQKLENQTLTTSQVSADVQKELKETKLFLKSSQQQLNEEKEKVERMQQMLNGLERQLSAAQAKAALKADEAPPATPNLDNLPPVPATPKVRRPPAPKSKPTPSSTPPDNAPQSDKVDNTWDATIPAPKAISPSLDPASTTPEKQSVPQEAATPTEKSPSE
jgi:hypothetical protein